jgi:hypothetical protein
MWPSSRTSSSDAQTIRSRCTTLACAEALDGRPHAALEHLTRALELKPDLSDLARSDEDLASLRHLPGWPV